MLTIAFMPDNERMVFVFSEVGNLDDATEEMVGRAARMVGVFYEPFK